MSSELEEMKVFQDKKGVNVMVYYILLKFGRYLDVILYFSSR